MTLTAMLAIVGGLILAFVIGQGAWAARKAGPRKALPPQGGVEPQMDDDAPAAIEPKLGNETPTIAEIVRARRQSTRIDALIDAIASVNVDSPVSGEMAIAHLPGSRRAGTKPFHIEGLNTETGDWEQPTPGQRYSEFQAGLQMANRGGALNEIEYSEFVQKLQGFVDGIGGFAQFPDMLDVVARARELDQFAAENDAQLAVLLRAKGASWTLGFVQQAALRHGFVPGAVPGRLVLPAIDEGLPPVLVLAYEAQAALAEAPEGVSLRELTLSLDVPQTPAVAEPFAAWQESARGLACDLEADICDDAGHVLNLHAFAAIDAELGERYKALAARDLASGSLAARRLFS
jgi:hypothetical protein